MNKWINTLIAIKGYWAVNNLASMADDASIMDEDEGGDEDDSAAPELSSDSAVEVAVDADALSQALRGTRTGLHAHSLLIENHTR